MRRDVRILLATAVIGVAGLWGGRLTDAMVTLRAFAIDHVVVRGVRYLSEDEVVGLLGLDPESSVWGDTELWRDRVVAHPLVRSARVTRRVPDGLLVLVVERTPIALAPTPTLEPVDAEGYRLPLDPAAYRLDLPILETTKAPPAGSRLMPEDVRRLAAEVDHLMASDTAFLQLVSSVEWSGRGAIVAHWSDPRVDFLLPTRAPPARLRQGLGALADAVVKSPGQVPVAIDLRFADQVVVRRGAD